MKKINLFLLTGIVFLSSCVVKKIKVYEENQAIKFLDETQKYTSTTRDDYVLLDLRDLNNSFANKNILEELIIQITQLQILLVVT